MRLRMNRRVTLALLFVFAVSVSLQGLAAAAAGMEMAASDSHAAMAMPSMGDPADCPSHDGGDQPSCMAMCAGITGILFETGRLPILQSHRTPRDQRAAALSERSILPEPHPPKPSALI